ncbi:MAG TPA: DUF998 domain-containing protein [Solirubrobacteraceae bacterium]|nr:DUF998 domain-containing protein [Solirubrobacteraceae bacterium]
MTKALLSCGALAGPLFVTTFTFAGRKREGYEPRRHPVSALALGPGGAVQRANFIATGALYLAGAAGLARTHGHRHRSARSPALIAAAGVGLIGAALFATDPVSGYPPDTSSQPSHPSRTGTLHTLCAIPVFVGIPLAALLSARAAARAHASGWAVYSAASGMLMAASAVLAGAGFGQHPVLVESGGLLQRVSIVTGFGWATALSIQRALDMARSSEPCPLLA